MSSSLLCDAGSAPRINTIVIENLRSIGSKVEVVLPTSGPLVLLGENNAGKSNIVRAFDILFGEYWPGSRQLEEHDFFGRSSDGMAIKLGAQVADYPCPYSCGGEITYIRWSYDRDDPARDGNPLRYSYTCSRCSKTYMNSAARSNLFGMKIDADRRLGYQLSYASRFTFLSKLMHRFHERLLSDASRRQKLEEIFTTLVNEFHEVTEFESFRQLLSTTAADLGQNLSYRLDIDFSAYDPSNFFRSLRIFPNFEGAVRSFDELGTGQEQILALAFAYAYAKAFGAV